MKLREKDVLYPILSIQKEIGEYKSVKMLIKLLLTHKESNFFKYCLEAEHKMNKTNKRKEKRKLNHEKIL